MSIMTNSKNVDDRIYFINGSSFDTAWDNFLLSLDGGVDLILTDPPFNIADKGGFKVFSAYLL